MVFKKQNYQSVYEYPKENASASPTQNTDRQQQQGWATYLANSSPFSSSVSDNDSFLIGHTVDDDDGDDDAIHATNAPVNFNALNGFAVSSSSRPFHLNQFGIECHTWPNESEFSWSQHQVNNKTCPSQRHRMFGCNEENSNLSVPLSSLCHFDQSEKEHTYGDISQSINDAGWPTNDDSSINDDQCELKSPNSMHRPDSGVGESVRL